MTAVGEQPAQMVMLKMPAIYSFDGEAISREELEISKMLEVVRIFSLCASMTYPVPV